MKDRIYVILCLSLGVAMYFSLRPKFISSFDRKLQKIESIIMAGEFNLAYSDINNEELIELLDENNLTKVFIGFDSIKRRKITSINCEMGSEPKRIHVNLYDAFIEYESSPIDPFRNNYTLRLVEIEKKKYWMLESSLELPSEPFECQHHARPAAIHN